MVCLALDSLKLDGATIAELGFLLLVGQEGQSAPPLVFFGNLGPLHELWVVRSDQGSAPASCGVDHHGTWLFLLRCGSRGTLGFLISCGFGGSLTLFHHGKELVCVHLLAAAHIGCLLVVDLYLAVFDTVLKRCLAFGIDGVDLLLSALDLRDTALCGVSWHCDLSSCR